MYAYVKKRLILPVFSILLLLAFMYSSITYAYKYESFIENKTLSDTKIAITNRNPSEPVVANIFIRNNDGYRVYLRTVLITPTNDLILPFGMGAHLQYDRDDTIATTTSILVPGYTMPTVTKIITSQTANPMHIDDSQERRFTQYCRDHGIQRMMRTDVINDANSELYEHLLRDIVRSGLELLPTQTDSEHYAPDGTPITLRSVTNFTTNMSPYKSLVVPQTSEHDWEVSGNYAYVMPTGETAPGVPIPYVIANVYCIDPEAHQNAIPLELLGKFILSPGEILPKFPGLNVHIIPIGYRNPNSLVLRCILPDGVTITPNFESLATRIEISDGIGEMHRTILQHGENWRMYERVRTAILRIIPQFMPDPLPAAAAAPAPSTLTGRLLNRFWRRTAAETTAAAAPTTTTEPPQIATAPTINTTVANTENHPPVTTAAEPLPSTASAVLGWVTWGLSSIIPEPDPF